MAFDPIGTFEATSAASRIPGLTLLCSSVVGGTTTTGCAAAPNLTLAGGFPQYPPPPTRKPSEFLTPQLQLNTNAPGTTLFAPDMKMPVVHEWSLSWQRELPFKMVMQASYVGRRGTHLYYAGNRNQSDPTAILPSYLMMQQNMRNGCLPSGTGPLVT